MTNENPPGHDMLYEDMVEKPCIPPSESKLRSRKFIITLIFMAAFIVGFFMGKVEQDTFLWFVATVLSLYGGANLVAKALERRP